MTYSIVLTLVHTVKETFIAVCSSIIFSQTVYNAHTVVFTLNRTKTTLSSYCNVHVKGVEK